MVLYVATYASTMINWLWNNKAHVDCPIRIPMVRLQVSELHLAGTSIARLLLLSENSKSGRMTLERSNLF